MIINELETILRRHAKLYPEMEITDAVKLVYQNEFGGGHLIKDRDSCIKRLKDEIAALTRPEKSTTVFEEIGNGIVRVYLGNLHLTKMTPEILADYFIASSKEVHGTVTGFIEKTDILLRLAEEGIFSFSRAELSEYLKGYSEAGFPPVSHSERYRAAYSPAYRIVLSKYIEHFY